MKFYYGAQYYRPPTPAKGDWERDFINMKKAGFNILKFWPMWRWHNPAPNKYYWEDLNGLMEKSKKHNFPVILNIILDTAPAWFLEKYPDCCSITRNGMKIRPVSDPCRQVGGYNVVCLHYPEYRKYAEKFIIELVKKYRNHPAMFVWDLWNEPWIPGGGFGDDRIENSVCYCKNTEREFKLWLKNKYKNIKNLNVSWSKNYTSFTQVELPVSYGIFTELADFRRFMMESVTSDLKWRAEIVRSLDKRHQVMTHPGISSVNSHPVTMGNDDWQLASQVDIFGGSAGGAWREDWGSARIAYEVMPMDTDALRSAGQGKDMWISEFHSFGGSAFHNFDMIQGKDLQRWTNQIIGRGSTGILYWQYHPEQLGFEAPAWGVCELDGSPGHNYKISQEIGIALQKYGEKITQAKMAKPECAILYNPDAYLIGWMMKYIGGGIDVVKCSRGAYKLFYDNSYSCDFIHPDTIAKISDYKIVYLPFPFALDEMLADKLKKYVLNGGIIISDAQIGSFRREDGWHSRTVPGYGLDEVFGCREEKLLPGEYYNKKKIEIVLGKCEIPGYKFREILKPTTGEVIGCFNDNEPAVVKNKYGKGYAILFGSYVSQAVIEYDSNESVHYFNLLFHSFGLKKPVDFQTTGRVHLDLLNGKGYDIITIINCDSQENTIQLLNHKYSVLQDIYTDREFNANSKIKLDALESKLFITGK